MGISRPLQDGEVTLAKLADGAVNGFKLAGNSVGASHFFQSGANCALVVKAWVNFNGTGTVAIRASGNVSSVTDNGTGDYTINFSAALADANYSVQVLAGFFSSAWAGSIEAAVGAGHVEQAPTAGGVRFCCMQYGGAPNDPKYVFVSVFR